MSDFTPRPEDRFSFGLWTVGWQAVDVFGRPPAAAGPGRGGDRLAGLGAAAVTFHDDDLVPDDATRDATLDRFGKALAETGLGVEMVTTNLFGDPVFKEGGADRQQQGGPPARPGQGGAQHRPRGRARRRDVRDVGRPRGRRARRRQERAGGARPVRRVRSTCCAPTSGSRATTIRFALEPKPNEPRGDILLPTIGHALAFISELEHPELVGLNPEVGHEEMAGLNFAHGLAQALWHGKLFHVDLNGQHGPRFDQDLRFGAGNLRGAFWTVDALLGSGAGNSATTATVHFDYKPPRAEAVDGVWESARACMRNYLILRERVRAFRADPEVTAALAAAGVPELDVPTLAEGESLADLRRRVVRRARALAERSVAMERPRPARDGAPARGPLTPST